MVLGEYAERDSARARRCAERRGNLPRRGPGRGGVEGRRDKDVAAPDAREVAQDRRHRGRELFAQRANAGGNFLATPATLNGAADDLVQRSASSPKQSSAETRGRSGCFCASTRLSGSSPPAPAGTVRFPNRPFSRNRRWATAAPFTKETILTFAPTPPQVSRKIAIRLERRRHACRTHGAP